jgi:hypothetical protein
LLLRDQGDAVPWQLILMQKQAQSDCHTTKAACERPRGCCPLTIDSCPEVSTIRLPRNRDCLCETKGVLSPDNRFLCRSKHNQIATQQGMLLLDQGDAVPWQSILVQKQAQSDCHATRIACARPRGCCSLAIDSCADVTTIRLPCIKDCLCETKGMLSPDN